MVPIAMFLGVTEVRCLRLTILKSGNLNLQEPSGPVQAFIQGLFAFVHCKLSITLTTASASNSTLALISRFRDACSFTSTHQYTLITSGDIPMEDIYLFIHAFIHLLII